MRRDEIISLVGQIKRDMPRNKPVMALCEEVERRIMESSQAAVPEVKAPLPAAILRRGRPRIGEVRGKPWEAAGMSRATWYRRQRELKATRNPTAGG